VKFTAALLAGSFSTATAARLCGLTPRQLDYWDRQGFLRPSLEAAKGYGSARRYSFQDLVRLRVAGRLRRAGFDLGRVRLAVSTLQRIEPGAASVHASRLVIAGDKVYWVRSERELVDVLAGGQLMLVFPLGEELQRIAQAAADAARGEDDRERPPARKAGRRA
jgi:DNA-binding transcriptional MerR regulator